MQLFDAESRTVLRLFKGHKKAVHAVTFGGARSRLHLASGGGRRRGAVLGRGGGG